MLKAAWIILAVAAANAGKIPETPTETTIDCNGRSDGQYVIGCSTNYTVCKKMSCGDENLAFNPKEKLCDYKENIAACLQAQPTAPAVQPTVATAAPSVAATTSPAPPNSSVHLLQNDQTNFGVPSFPKCDSCDSIINEVGANVELIIANIRLRTVAICETDDKSTKVACKKAREHALSVMRDVNNQVFPYTSDVNPRMTCSQILKVCPDVSKDGTQVPAGRWSCSSCEEALSLLVHQVGPRLPELNNAIQSAFCAKDDRHCNNQFKDSIQFGGAIGDLFKYLKSPERICQQVMACVK